MKLEEALLILSPSNKIKNDILIKSEQSDKMIKNQVNSKSITKIMSMILGSIQQGWTYHVQVKEPPARMLTKAFVLEISEISEEIIEGYQFMNPTIMDYEFDLRQDRNPGKYLLDLYNQILVLRYKAFPDKDDPIHTPIADFLKIVKHFGFELKDLH